MHDERDEPQAETFNQDQQEMFQNPDTSLGETRPRTPGEQNAPPTFNNNNIESNQDADERAAE